MREAAHLSHSGVGLGEDHLDHVQGDGEEGPLLVHLLQLRQLPLLDQLLQEQAPLSASALC